MLEEMIQQYLTLCESDPALLEFSRKRSIIIHYFIADGEIEFYMVFKDGAVQTGMGTPPQTATLDLTMGEKTFISVMDGDIDGMAAALKGELKFKGDPLKAIALQKIQSDLNRIWKKIQPDR